MNNSTQLGHILVVTRDLAALGEVWAAAEAHDRRVEALESGWEALEHLRLGKTPHLVLLEMSPEDSDGLHTLRWLRRIHPDMPVILLASTENEQRRNEAIRLGASDYLVKPLSEMEWEALFRSCLIPLAAELGPEENEEAQIEPLGDDRFFVAASPMMHKLWAQAKLLAQANVPVLVVGEKGSGKDAVARLIHRLSVRSGFHFARVDCAALPGDLLESELFGHADARAMRKPSKIELCARGTILLNDVQEMPFSLQERLLRLIQAQQENHGTAANGAESSARIIAAIAGKIEDVLALHKLREDFYYQLSAFTVHVPPLRHRRQEIPLLMGHLMKHLAKHYELPTRAFSPRLLAMAQTHDWPGNFEELESFVKRYLATGEEDLRSAEFDTQFQAGHATVHNFDARSAQAEMQVSGSGLKTLVDTIKGEAERNAIAGALETTHWNRKAAARLLKVSYRTLLYKIQQYQMSPRQSQFFSAFAQPGAKGNGPGP